MKKVFGIVLFLLSAGFILPAQTTIFYGPFNFTTNIPGAVVLSENKMSPIVDTVGITTSNQSTGPATFNINFSTDNSTWVTATSITVAAGATSTVTVKNQAGLYVQVLYTTLTGYVYGTVFGQNSAIGAISISKLPFLASLQLTNTFVNPQNAPTFNASSYMTSPIYAGIGTVGLSPGPGAGTGATVGCYTGGGGQCTEVSGMIQLNTGTTPAIGQLVVVSWGAATPYAVNCTFSPGGNSYPMAASGLQIGEDNASTTSYGIGSSVVPAASTTYFIMYHCGA